MMKKTILNIENRLSDKTLSPFFSIITIVWNGEKYLEQAILSVINQSCDDWEYIIVDGGSTDNSISIIQKYNQYLSYWCSEPDKGISDAFNKGIKKANGEYIGIVNADDWLNKESLEIVKSKIKINFDKKIDIICGGVNFWENEEFLINAPSDVRLITRESSIQHAASFISKNAFSKHGLYLQKYKLAMDYELFLRMYMQRANIIAINETLANRRLEGVSYKNYYKSLIEVRKIRNQYFSKFNTSIMFCTSIIKGWIGQNLKKNGFMRLLYQFYWKIKSYKAI